MLTVVLAIKPQESDPGCDLRITDSVYGLTDRLNTPGVASSLNDLLSSGGRVAS